MRTSCSADLDVQRIDPQLLAARRDVLCCQHGCVGRRLVAVGFDLHAAGDAGDGFTATGITQEVSLRTTYCVSKAFSAEEMRCFNLRT